MALIDEIDVSLLSPMMQVYLDTKKQYRDCILFYRLGDFYEMFFDDALIASKVLEITLTGKDCGLSERAPMCGIPFHAYEMYMNKLVASGYKVAIAEQLEDPKQAKGLVKRDVIRIVTPGTITNAQALDETRNNYMLSIFRNGDYYGLACADVLTGEFNVTEVSSLRILMDELYKFTPSEVICNESFSMLGDGSYEELKLKLGFLQSVMDSWYFDEESSQKKLKQHYKIEKLAGLGLEEYPLGIIAAGAMLKYLEETQKSSLDHFTTITPYSTGKYMVLDTSTRRNLELCETLRDKNKRGSLLWVLDKTKTAMGARLLRSYIEQPLIDTNEITKRLDAVSVLVDDMIAREEIREYLNPIYDLERLIGRISFQSANPRDLIAFKNSLKMIPYIRDILSSLCDHSSLLSEIFDSMDPLMDLCDLIERAIVEEPPISIREGGMIKDGFHEEADRLRSARTDGKKWISDIEAAERERTGIPKLKIGYNKVFGYYLEVTNSYKAQVPEDYIRKQTLTGAERYITPKLKEIEDMVLGAQDRLFALEYELFCNVRDEIAKSVVRIQKTAKAVAMIDTLASLAAVASSGNYVRPTICKDSVISIKDGRHPVVEKMIPDDLFVSNDVNLDTDSNRMIIITGPNMAGKSTYMRQVALITLMAQIGSFVPAQEATIGICDRIFTRVGASDDLASGQSTFMVEMTEVANILRNATQKSLIVLDEIGRGTSTFDGLSIAWAVVEHIADAKQIGARTLFATHYHELTELDGIMEGVHNYCIAVKEQGDDIVFLRKIIPGGADKSYGIQVAKLAGVPDLVIRRAKELLSELTNADINVRTRDIAVNHEMNKNLPPVYEQNSIFSFLNEDSAQMKVANRIKDINLSTMTPIEALNLLYSLQEELK